MPKRTSFRRRLLVRLGLVLGLALTGVAGTVPSPKPTDPALHGLWIGLLAAVAAAVYFALVRRVAPAFSTTQ